MQPRNPVLLGQQGLVQKECTFNVGDHVYDDVFECDGIVLQLPLESETMNRGKIHIGRRDLVRVGPLRSEGSGGSVNHTCIIAARSGH